MTTAGVRVDLMGDRMAVSMSVWVRGSSVCAPVWSELGRRNRRVGPTSPVRRAAGVECGGADE